MPKEKWFTDRQLRDIGRFVSYMKGVHGMNGQYFADVFDVSPSTISEYEHGKRNLSPEKALKLVMAATTQADEIKINALIASIPRLSQEVKFGQLIEELDSQTDYTTKVRHCGLQSSWDGHINMSSAGSENTAANCVNIMTNIWLKNSC